MPNKYKVTRDKAIIIVIKTNFLRLILFIILQSLHRELATFSLHERS